MDHITSNLVLELRIREYAHPWEQLEWVNEAIVVRVPDHKIRLACPEDVFELIQVYGEVVADWFEWSVVVSELGQSNI